MLREDFLNLYRQTQTIPPVKNKESEKLKIKKNNKAEKPKALARSLSRLLVVLGNVSRDGSSTRISDFRPRWGPTHDRWGTLSRELLIKHASVPVRLLGVRRVVSPFGLRTLHLLIRDHLFGGVLYRDISGWNQVHGLGFNYLEDVNPSVANTIAKLLLLAPENVVGKVRLSTRLVASIKGLSQDEFLNTLLGDKLFSRIHIERNLKEL